MKKVRLWRRRSSTQSEREATCLAKPTRKLSKISKVTWPSVSQHLAVQFNQCLRPYRKTTQHWRRKRNLVYPRFQLQEALISKFCHGTHRKTGNSTDCASAEGHESSDLATSDPRKGHDKTLCSVYASEAGLGFRHCERARRLLKWCAWGLQDTG